jgi:SAM-dependent methyltransferase
VTTQPPLYGPEQSRFARYLERREQRKPDLLAREHRRGLLAGLRGRVVEVGCGDGRAFDLYPPEVAGVVAVEPDSTARAVAAERAREAVVPIDVVDGTAEALPAVDGAFDAAVAVWVLCSIPDPPPRSPNCIAS